MSKIAQEINKLMKVLSEMITIHLPLKIWVTLTTSWRSSPHLKKLAINVLSSAFMKRRSTARLSLMQTFGFVKRSMRNEGCLASLVSKG